MEKDVCEIKFTETDEDQDRGKKRRNKGVSRSLPEREL